MLIKAPYLYPDDGVCTFDSACLPACVDGVLCYSHLYECAEREHGSRTSELSNAALSMAQEQLPIQVRLP